MEDTNIVCLKWGQKYPPDYVNRLFSMVKRHLHVRHRFVCLADDSRGISRDVEIKPIGRKELSHSWNKLLLFQNPLFDLSGTVLYLDLDIVILGELEPFLEYKRGCPFLGVIDWYNKYTYNTSVMRFEAGRWFRILSEYLRFRENGTLVLSTEDIQGEPGRTPIYIDTRKEAKKFKHRGRYPGDQNWVTDHIHPKGVRKRFSFPKGWCLSYKKHCEGQTPPGSPRIVAFHGRPKPHEVEDPWVKENWR